MSLPSEVEAARRRLEMARDRARLRSLERRMLQGSLGQPSTPARRTFYADAQGRVFVQQLENGTLVLRQFGRS